MFSEKDLQALLDFSAKGQVLSVYLNTDPTETNQEAAKIRMRNLVKNIDLPEDVEAVTNYVNFEYGWDARGLAIFSDQHENFFQTYRINLSVPDQAMVADTPIVRPMVRLADTFKGWGVILVDKQGARFFSFNLGELVEMESVSGEEVRQTKRGGGNAMPGRMGGSGASGNVENTIDRNIKEVIDQAVDFFSRHHIRRIMIGGTDDNIARFKEELPKSWQSLVVAEFPMSMTASTNDILEKALQAARSAQTKQTRNLVEQAVTLAAKGSSGVIGLIDTLNANHEGRVKTLLVAEDFKQEGYRCTECGFLTVQELDQCPFCGGSFETIDNAVEMAVQEALTKGADVKVISEDEELAEAGNIAAILRY